ncbi:carboxypeptidase-like regulatory domain-containing protein [Hymenobacter sediminicola]|uniref:Carboxypeptidase-like regulatory domain-containing protein n=1 Tax=Hymenobacter sediminicola TaxID=2761579 RepID=A0A7G7W719_9BACT|nr:carboxypeptidase-like regulatory domain-containing protein [Hymenobacter sediminicola]QNH62162.1 carboxypeptidase-like regulatory domain-containing protein [Hymenobacter sediminicola]
MAFSVPSPCPKSWAAMTPTADGRHCASCQHEVVDFSGMSEAEVTAWLARPAAGGVCGFFRAGQFAPVAAPQPRWRKYLLAAVALLGLKPLLAVEEAAALSPRREVPRATEQADSHAEAPKGQVTVRGRVLDDSTGLGVQGAEIFIGDTPYGAVTDEQGNFSFTMKQLWAPVQNNLVNLRVQASPFVFEKQTVAVKVSPAPAPLTVRLKSIPGRGQIMGRIAQHEPPQKPPLD